MPTPSVIQINIPGKQGPVGPDAITPRGQWSAGTYVLRDVVWHEPTLKSWYCNVASTTQVPGAGSDWVVLIDTPDAVAAIEDQEADSIAAVQSQQTTSVAAVVTQQNTSTTAVGVAAENRIAQIGAVPIPIFPSGAASNVPRGVLSAAVSAGGSGGTNGTFALSWTGGNFSANPVGTFTVAGGVMTAISISEPGLYIGASPTAPTPVFTASSGLSGASATLTTGFRVASGSYYWVAAADNTTASLYLNVAGTATITSPLVSSPLSALVTSIVGDQSPRTPSNSESWREGRLLAYALDHTTADWNMWDDGVTSMSTFAQNGANERIHLCWDTGQLGFTEAGWLTELEVHTGQFDRSSTGPAVATTTGAKLQAWVMRPTATLPTTAASVTVNRVAAIGEVNLPDGQSDLRDHVKFTGLNIPVQVGDVIALRIIAAPIRMLAGANVSPTDTWVSLLITDTDLSISTALNTSKTATATTSAARRRFPHRATIVKNDHQAAGNSPRGPVRLSAAGRIPRQISRNTDNPWHGRRVAIMGSSISTLTGGGTGAVRGHWPRVMDMLCADGFNLAVGGSLGLWPSSGGTASLLVAGTEAEFVARFGAGGDPGQWSYERRVIGQQFDAVIMPDCINDTNNGASIGTRGTTDRSTLWGAFSRMIEAILNDRPQCIIFLQTPAHRWASYGTPGTDPTELALRIQFADAMYEIAAWYGLPEPIDFIRRGGIGASRVKAGTGLIDTIHPAETNGPKPQMARYAAHVMMAYGTGEVLP